MAEQKISIPGNNRPEEICEPCMGTVQCKAYYNDRWQTPIVGANIVMTDRDGNLFDGLKTQALKDFGCEDGQNIDPHRPLLGTCKQTGLRQGNVKIKLEPDPSAAAQAKQLEQQINQKLQYLTNYVEQQMAPWIKEWEKDGLIALWHSASRGATTGMIGWWEGEVEFWSWAGEQADSFVDWASKSTKDLKDTLIKKGEEYAEYLKDKPWYYYTTYGVIAYGSENLAETLTQLWEHKDKIMALVRSFAEANVNATQSLLEQLEDLPGEVGGIIKALVKHSAEWAGLMIELFRETDVLENLFKTTVGIIMMIPPNLVVEGAYTLYGYIIPEIIIALIFMAITALTEGAAAPLLAARIAKYTKTIYSTLKKLGKIGEVLSVILKTTSEIVQLITKLAKALKRNIDEAIEGLTHGTNEIIRKIRKQGLDVKPGSPAHRAKRWAEYQERGGTWTKERWDKQYDVNMQQAKKSHKAVDDYRKRHDLTDENGWGVEKTLKDGQGTERRLDIVHRRRKKAIEHKRGKQYLSKSNLSEIMRDTELMKNTDWEISWHFDDYASKPLLEKLDKMGIPWTIGN